MPPAAIPPVQLRAETVAQLYQQADGLALAAIFPLMVQVLSQLRRPQTELRFDAMVRNSEGIRILQCPEQSITLACRQAMIRTSFWGFIGIHLPCS
jgi:hypothetical protein